jgi:hypothetical protein
LLLFFSSSSFLSISFALSSLHSLKRLLWHLPP